ncbi:transglycosylase family protein [Streptomyces sp. NPDC127106]|uniref:LysM peptidoglycan-binding domain-containing protein n=1 Tax=Streptomyces sp. NPDC127106 TaxID=3345360 RepID=UPI0036379F9C
MRSGNGRHRRPRQVPAIVVTAGVTGSALAMPLLAATGASAAEAATWDKVAECESGGTWSANTGSGAYGGLQFTQEEWKNAGGEEFAERADLASRSQQIAVAERVLGSQGPEAWQNCAAQAGLTKDAPAADVDPGAKGQHRAIGQTPSRPDAVVPPTGSGNRPTDYGAPTPAPDYTLPPAPTGPSSGLPVMPAPDGTTAAPTLPPVFPGDPTANPVTPTPTAPGIPGATPGIPGATPGTPGATPGAPGATSGVTPGATAPGTPGAPNPGSAPATPAVPSALSAPGASGASGAPGASTDPGVVPDVTGTGKHRGTPAVEVSPASYTVKEGDSLATIADAKGVQGGWGALYKANEQVIGGDADLIKPGQNLDLSRK